MKAMIFLSMTAILTGCTAKEKQATKSELKESDNRVVIKINKKKKTGSTILLGGPKTPNINY